MEGDAQLRSSRLVRRIRPCIGEIAFVPKRRSALPQNPHPPGERAVSRIGGRLEDRHAVQTPTQKPAGETLGRMGEQPPTLTRVMPRDPYRNSPDSAIMRRMVLGRYRSTSG